MTFKTPLRDMRFSLTEQAGFGALADTGAFPELDAEIVEAMTEEMGKFADNVVAPLNEISDREGATLENGVVRTTPGFKDAYRQYAEGGWMGLAFPEEFGGQGLPHALNGVLIDALNGACMSFAIGLTLTTGAIKALSASATDEQKRLFLPKMVSGEWTGTMNLTEPQAGSDLSGVRTRATPVGDGRYKIDGQKIYITYGEHDLADNICHLVLARLPDAPEGTRGISMFLVPKLHVNEDGSLGVRNDLKCIGLEHKMGLHGSPTCTMAFGENGECYGTLVGAENEGLKNMFVMMNSARVDVGLQGVGVAERAYQRALAYALDRRQGRAFGVKTGDQVAIFEHPDVRRMLYTMKTMVEASRAICYANGVAADLSHHAQDEKTRTEAAMLDGLLTPISKAFSTDAANEVASIGVQVHGGMGFIEETGAAQHMRDARIAAIYEGTNGIQAIDLIGRKLSMKDGEVVKGYIAAAREQAAALENVRNGTVQAIGKRLAAACAGLDQSTDWLLERLKASPEDALAGATPYQRQFGLVAGGRYLAAGALAAAKAAEAGDDPAYHEGKVKLAAFYAENLLPAASGWGAAATAGAETTAKIDPELLSA